MVKPNAMTCLALHLFVLGFPGHAAEFGDKIGDDSTSKQAESNSLPDMDLLIYLGGWEINDKESQEPLYWYESQTDNGDKHATATTEKSRTHDAD